MSDRVVVHRHRTREADRPRPTGEPQVQRQGLLREITDPDLYRMTAERADDGDGLNIEGYWAVFDTPTLIDSWEGTFYEQNAQGSFKKSLRFTTPRMQFDHGRHPLIGSLPLGTWQESFEDDHGAYSRGRLSDNWLVEPFRDAIADGAVTGMSYRFQVIREVWHDSKGNKVKPEDVPDRIWASAMTEEDLLTRTVLEAKVSEAGPVVWPAYEDTEVSVRSKVTIDLGRLDEPDQRATLARAVILADESARRAGDDAASLRRPLDRLNAENIDRTCNTDRDGSGPDAPPAPTEAPEGTPPGREPVIADAPPAPVEAPEGHPSVPPPLPATSARAELRATARDLSAYVATMRGATRSGR